MYRPAARRGRSMDDGQLLALYERREEAAIAKTEQAYGAVCRRMAYGILENEADADEVLNEA